MDYNFQEIINNFNFEGDYIYIERYGCGHINDTYAVYFKNECVPPVRYILQRINNNVFKNPVRLMENISGVTNYLEKKNESGDSRHTLKIVKTKDENNFYLDNNKNYWRAYYFIENATAYQKATPELFLQSGVAFGRFSNLLADYPAHNLYESIPDFHNTRKRYEAFEEAVSLDIKGRASQVLPEINFARKRKEDTGILVDMLSCGKLPLKVTHNDTKLNNVMIDNETGEGICVIDLDTVMPGLLPYDFGDSIRFGASTADEDEKDLSKVSLSLELFENYTKGYLSQARESMSQNELDILPFAAKLITFECGIRFLTDFLNGDIYFKTAHQEHNLDRCRTQFKLVEDIESKLDIMTGIVKRYS